MSSRVLGIDLGTVNSCVAVVKDGRAVVLGEGTRNIIPSCLAFQRGKEIVGDAAKRQRVTDPHNTISAVKRLMGHAYESKEVQTARERAPYPIRPSPLGSVLIEVAGKELTPVQVSARVLARIKEVAEQALGESVQKAVISVPAYFNDVQRKATKLAAEYAGLEVVRLVNEPTAAAFAYGYRKGEDFTLAVYDLGGGTFDITIMKARGDTFEVLATDGDSYLGGEDFDSVIESWLVREFTKATGADLAGDQSAQLRVREAAEKAKCELSDMEQAQIELPFLTQLKDGSRPTLKMTLTRAKLEELVQPLVKRTLELCESCMREAGIQKIQIDEVLLVGGQSRMPAVRDAVTAFFGRKPRRDINPDEVVAMGAALYGYSLAADELGREARGDAEEQYAVAVKQTAIIEKMLSDVHTQIKKRSPEDEGLRARLQSLLAETQSFESLAPTRSKKPDDHDLPVALERMQERLAEVGSVAQDVIDQLAEEISADIEENGESPLAAEAARLTAELEKGLDFARGATNLAQQHLSEADLHAQARKVELIDVTSHSLGIATAADLFGVLIEHNSPVPCEQQRLFTTNADDQQEVEIRVLQGRERKASENQFLGSFVLEGIAPARRMVPKISVTFRIDENGILAVTACDGDTGAAQSMRVEDPLGLQQVKAPEPESMTIEGNSTPEA